MRSIRSSISVSGKSNTAKPLVFRSRAIRTSSSLSGILGNINSNNGDSTIGTPGNRSKTLFEFSMKRIQCAIGGSAEISLWHEAVFIVKFFNHLRFAQAIDRKFSYHERGQNQLRVWRGHLLPRCPASDEIRHGCAGSFRNRPSRSRSQQRGCPRAKEALLRRRTTRRSVRKPV